MKKTGRNLIILGAGGHAKVLIDCLSFSGYNIIGITDADKAKYNSKLLGLNIIGPDDEVFKYGVDEVHLINGLGSVDGTEKRARLYRAFKEKGYNFLRIIHPSAVVARQTSIGEGCQIMAGAIVQPGCLIGDNVIINTNASVDHDCAIGSNVHIAPGVVLSGGVNVGEGVHIGTGSVFIQGVTIGDKALIGAGSLILRDVTPGVKMFGSQGREVKE